MNFCRWCHHCQSSITANASWIPSIWMFWWGLSSSFFCAQHFEKCSSPNKALTTQPFSLTWAFVKWNEKKKILVHFNNNNLDVVSAKASNNRFNLFKIWSMRLNFFSSSSVGVSKLIRKIWKHHSLNYLQNLITTIEYRTRERRERKKHAPKSAHFRASNFPLTWAISFFSSKLKLLKHIFVYNIDSSLVESPQ